MVVVPLNITGISQRLDCLLLDGQPQILIYQEISFLFPGQLRSIDDYSFIKKDKTGNRKRKRFQDCFSLLQFR